MTSISKIIHQTAPKDTTKWHPIWKMCQDSWKKNYVSDEYTYKFWDDNDIEEIIKIDFPMYYKLFLDFGKDVILKVDFVRYAILYKYGGIYADMDFFCYKNFYNLLENKICIVGSGAYNEIVQNSLMASPPNDPLWLTVLENCKNYFYEFKSLNPDTQITGQIVIDITGPRLLSRALDLSKIHILPTKLFNPSPCMFNSSDIYSKHYGTGKWGPSSGIREYNELREYDMELKSVYDDKKYMHPDLPDGYIAINVGNSNIVKKTISVDIQFDSKNEILLAKNRYSDTFSIEQNVEEKTITLTRTDQNSGWGHNHYLYIKMCD